MKKFLMAVAVLACGSTLALAGPNAGGTLVAHDANLLLSATVPGSLCPQGLVPTDCQGIDTEIDGATGPAAAALFKVYAAFPTGSAPRLLGLTWGVTYPPQVLLAGSGMCGDFELNDPTWPLSGTGSSVTWTVPQTSLLVPVYWFAGYTYYATDSGVFMPGPNPDQGGNFGDDTVPAIIDVIAGYGGIGFNTAGTPPSQGCPHEVLPAPCCNPQTGECTMTLPDGCVPPNVYHPEFASCTPNNPCPPPPPGACCDATGACTFVPQIDCTGQYMGDGVPCDPNPCTQTGACCNGTVCSTMTQADCVAGGGTYMGDQVPCTDQTCVVPVQPTTWGSIKNIYSR